MNQDIENIKEQLEEVVRKHLPEEKIISNEEFNSIQEDYSGGLLEGEILGHNQCLSQINTEVITQKILEVIKKEIHDCMCEHNEARHGDKPDDAYDRVLNLFTNYE